MTKQEAREKAYLNRKRRIQAGQLGNSDFEDGFDAGWQARSVAPIAKSNHPNIIEELRVLLNAHYKSGGCTEEGCGCPGSRLHMLYEEFQQQYEKATKCGHCNIELKAESLSGIAGSLITKNEHKRSGTVTSESLSGTDDEGLREAYQLLCKADIQSNHRRVFEIIQHARELVGASLQKKGR